MSLPVVNLQKKTVCHSCICILSERGHDYLGVCLNSGAPVDPEDCASKVRSHYGGLAWAQTAKTFLKLALVFRASSKVHNTHNI